MFVVSELLVKETKMRRLRSTSKLMRMCERLSLSLCLVQIVCSSSNGLETYRDPREYCEAEEFKTSCGPEEVGVVVQAQYGRMALGRCVKTDYGYVGCFADVRDHLDDECSGRRTCQIRIPDQELDVTKPCPSEFKTYLNATYKCVQVERAACQSCSLWKQAKLTSKRGYLASVVTSEDPTGCGTSQCPWVIEAKTGQRINVTLFDFGFASHTSARDVPGKTCLRYAVIKEQSATHVTPVCGLQAREHNVYTSTGNVIEIHVVNQQVFEKRGQFLLYYEAIGCEDVSPPDKFTEIRRENDNLTVGCTNSNKKWKLHCVGSTWQGQTGICSSGLETSSPHNSEDNSSSFPMVILIAVVAAIALVIMVCILTIGFVYLKRHHLAQQQAHMESIYYGRQSSYDAPLQEYLSVGGDQTRKYVTYPRPKQPRNIGQQARDNVYLRRMESRPLPPIPDQSEGETGSEESRSLATADYRACNAPMPGPRGMMVHHRGFSTGQPPQSLALQLMPVTDQMYNQSLMSNPMSIPSSLNSPTGTAAESREGIDYFMVDQADEAGLPPSARSCRSLPSGISDYPLRITGTVGDDCRVGAPTSFVRQMAGGTGGFSSHDIPLRPARDGSQLSNSDNSGRSSLS